MPAVLQMTRVLSEQPIVPVVPGVQIRNIRIPDDIEDWLELRRRAFAESRISIREWTRDDFTTEFLHKPWWRAEAMWIAEANGFVGSVTLARRGNLSDAKPVVHWLMVDPQHRRRGIGRSLLAALESAVWNAGERQVWLETHANWNEAFQFYTSLGFYRC